MSTSILILNENAVPKEPFYLSIHGKEWRLRSALKSINAIHVVTFKLLSPANSPPPIISPLEAKIHLHFLPSVHQYLKPLFLFFYGFYYLKRFQPKFIETESPIFSGLAGVLLGKLFKLPVVVEIRTDFISMTQFRLNFLPLSLRRHLVQQLIGYVLSQAKLIVCNSQTFQRFAHSYNPNTVVVNPGLPPSTPNLTPANPPPPYHLGYLGRLAAEKGPQILIAAAAILKHTPALPPWDLTLAGDGILKSSLQDQINRLKLNSHVQLIGFQSNFSYLSQLHLLINPCLADAPLEMVNVEAASIELPVITFGRHGLPETVIQKQTGLVVWPKTATALASAIISILNQPSTLTSLSHAGPKFAQTHFSFSSQANRLQVAYRQSKLL